MKRTQKILVLVLAAAAMCAVIGSFLKVFQQRLILEVPVPAPLETVYYAPLETPAEPTQTVPPETVPVTVPQTIPETAEAAAEPTAAPTEEPIVPETNPDRTHYDTVPNFYETDYPDIRFGNGSFADYGSGVTSVAMVATYLTGYEYRPDELASWFSNYIGNQIQILEYISD